MLRLLALLGMHITAHGLDNGLARTPPMGWLSWERYMCNTDCKGSPDSCISERLYMAMADALVAGGYRDAGYVYVNIDDCWQNRSRTAAGVLQADSERFPHGIAWLANFMHARGLKLGIYTDYGSHTCEGYPGTDSAHMAVDAKTFAAWGVDSVKVDGCNSNSSTMNEAYPRLGDLLNATGRPMLYSCSWPDYLQDHVNFSYVAEKCNLWRMYRDIYSQFPIIQQIVEFYGKSTPVLQPVAGPGAWNDADQLTVGDHHVQGWCKNSSDRVPPRSQGSCNGLSRDESETMMALWSMFASPMLMSNDLRTVKPWAKAILLDKEVLRISQDPLGVQAVKIVDNTTMGNRTITTCSGAGSASCTARTFPTYPVGGSEVWAKPLAGGDVAVTLYNKNAHPDEVLDIEVALDAISAFNSSVHGVQTPLFNVTYSVLFNHTPANCSAYGGALCSTDFSIVARAVPAHASRTYRITRAPTLWIPNDGSATKSIVLNSSGFFPGNAPWKLVDGVIRFECGKFGWDGSLPKGAVKPWWVTFDLGAATAIDGFGLWNSGKGSWDVAQFSLQTAAAAGGPWANVSNSTKTSQTKDGELQVFEGFEATARFWRWWITKTAGNQPWVKEVQLRKAHKTDDRE